MTKLELLALVVVLLTGVVYGSPPDEKELPDDEQELLILQVGNRLAHVTYEESLDLDMTSTMTMMGQTSDMVMQMQMDSETTVEDLPQGGQTVRTTLTHVAMDSAMGGFTMKCDTNTPQTKADAYCVPLYSLVNHEMDFVVDDRGHVAEKPTDLDNDSAAKQLQATSRLLQLVPKHPIKVGESWDASEEMPGLGYFEGTSDFLGWQKSDNNDGSKCAIIKTVGTLEIDFAQLAESMGDQMAAGMNPSDIIIKDAKMAAKLCWDDEAKMAVWGETDLSFTMIMAMDQQGGALEMPIHEVIKTTCQIKDD